MIVRIKASNEMVRLCWLSGRPPLHLSSFHSQKPKYIQCCSNTRNSRKNYAIFNRETETPQILKMAVSGVTELLRLFSPNTTLSNQRNTDEFPVSSVDDVLMIIKSDYNKAYFVTGKDTLNFLFYFVNDISFFSGNFTSSVYAENCIFEDPTIRFRGRELYARNLKLLVPFFDCASIRLQNIEKDVGSDTTYVRATWNLRTNLKLPWRPLISIDGSTFYELDEEFKIVRHVESWNVSALEAIMQIFTFNF